MDPIMARIWIMTVICRGDGNVSDLEAQKMSQVLVTAASPADFQDKFQTIVRLSTELGPAKLTQQCIAELSAHYPDRVGRSAIVRECIMVASADGIDPAESELIGSLMETWGLDETDFANIDPAVALMALFSICGIGSSDTLDEAEVGRIAELGWVRCGSMERAKTSMQEAMQLLGKYGIDAVLQLAISSLSAAHPDRETRRAIARECFLVAQADGEIDRAEALAVFKVFGVWGLDPQDMN